MKKTAFSCLLLGVLGVGFLAGTLYNERERVSAAGLRARKVIHYVDPMHPAYKSEQPGTAPDCGMPLEPVYEDASPAGADPKVPLNAGRASISPEKQHLIGVRVSPVEKTMPAERLRLYGRVAPDETRSYTIGVGIDGFVRELSTVTTGSHVRKDDWLATYSAPDARLPIQGYLVALEVLERAAKSAEGPAPIDAANASLQQSIDRLLTLGMSRPQIDEIGRTRLVPPSIRITAPVDGFVLSRSISTGQKFERGDELYRIVDLRRVWVVVDVLGAEADYIRPGMAARVRLPGRGTTFDAKVSRDVLPQFDATRQSVSVRLEAENPAYLLRPDMFVDVELALTLAPTIVLPVDAVLDSGLRKTVFVERHPGLFEPREVETGWRFGDRMQIVSGLEPGERVVVSGTFLLDSESRIRHTASETKDGSR